MITCLTCFEFKRNAALYVTFNRKLLAFFVFPGKFVKICHTLIANKSLARAIHCLIPAKNNLIRANWP